MNVFYIPCFVRLISYIYKRATNSHFKPGLLMWRLWLGFSQILEDLFPKIIIHRDSRIEVLPDLRTSQISTLLNFARFRSFLNVQQNCEPKPSLAINSWNIQKVSNLCTATDLRFRCRGAEHLLLLLDTRKTSFIAKIFRGEWKKDPLLCKQGYEHLLPLNTHL
jgi:hypothetical protein